MTKRYSLLFAALIFVFFACSQKQFIEFSTDFNNTYNRVWIGQDFWSIPLEDWRIQDGRLENVGNRFNMRVNLLTCMLSTGPGSAEISVRLGVLGENGGDGTAGIRLGIIDKEESDPRAACYFGTGLDIGVNTNGWLFAGDSSKALPDTFDYKEMTMSLRLSPEGSGSVLRVRVVDKAGNGSQLELNVRKISGLLALVNQFYRTENEKIVHFWFDDLKISGTKLKMQPENAFGPILWAMYTQSRGTVKLTAQMPPLGDNDNHKVVLELKKKSYWEKLDQQDIQMDSYTATFRMENWDATQDVPYRLVYTQVRKDGSNQKYFYTGTIRRDPVDKPLVVGGMTCQFGTGFPYSPVVKNLTIHNPDLLYFSGDQIYESNGGYGIIRFPADRAILNYLGKYYMFGWAFGDLMRNRPTICTPDDHDVFQGNLWGESGKKIPFDQWQLYRDSIGGYVEPAAMVNVVHKTQCSHLPDPYDPAPVQQDICVFYTDLVYGRIGFAIVSDRMFKTGPKAVSFWSGRADHLQERLPDMSVLERPWLKLLGDRQVDFLKNWVVDWRATDMKVLLSQTVFANIATHHGEDQMVLYADLDSGGWPKTGRDRAIDSIRKGFVFHIAGDQHVPTLSQYGIDEFQDAGWVFVTPAIYVGYERRFLPDRLGLAIANPPAHGLPNTGQYIDPFDNLQFVYAVGNPADEPATVPRTRHGQDKSSGYGIIRFDQQGRKITVEAYRYLADVSKQSPNNLFPGWPHTIDQLDNYGRQIKGKLPAIQVNGIENPVFIVTNENTGDLEYALRINGGIWAPFVFTNEKFTVKVGEPDVNKWKVFNHLELSGSDQTMVADF